MSPSCLILQLLLIQNIYLVPAVPRTRTDRQRGQTVAWRRTQTEGPSEIAQKRRDYATEPQMKPAERSRVVLNGSWYTPSGLYRHFSGGGVVPSSGLFPTMF